jgi:hypothetical protein
MSHRIETGILKTAPGRQVGLGLSGSASTFLRSDGTEATPPSTPGGGIIPYMAPFWEAIDDPLNDNFRVGNGAGGMDTSGTRFSGAGAWTAENIGASVVSVASGRLNLKSPTSASVQIRGYYQAVPSGNWCIRMNLSARPNTEIGGQRSVGMYLRDSTSGKLELWGIAYNTAGASTMLWSSKMTNATTFSATRTFSAFGSIQSLAHFIEIEYDGTNYYLRWGWNDQPLYRHVAFAKTDFLTAAADGIGVFSANWESDPTTLISRGIYRVPVSSEM